MGFPFQNSYKNLDLSFWGCFGVRVGNLGCWGGGGLRVVVEGNPSLALQKKYSYVSNLEINLLFIF